MAETTGVVYILDGAGGSGWTPYIVRRSLAHLPYEVHHFKWGQGYMRIIHDLTNKQNIQNKAAELAELIKAQRRKGHKVYVVAKSAGTMVALSGLALLEPDTVERAILMSPAVSPQFPLDAALRA